jgi:hypothetical protein
MRYILLASFALFLNACATYDFVPTPVPELISKVTYTTTDVSGKSTWQIDNDTLKVRYTKASNNGQLISQRVTKATPNDFNIIATDLENADFKKATSQQGARRGGATGQMIIETSEGNRVFTQNNTTHFPDAINEVAKTIPQLF